MATEENIETAMIIRSTYSHTHAHRAYTTSCIIPVAVWSFCFKWRTRAAYHHNWLRFLFLAARIVGGITDGHNESHDTSEYPLTHTYLFPCSRQKQTHHSHRCAMRSISYKQKKKKLFSTAWASEAVWELVLCVHQTSWREGQQKVVVEPDIQRMRKEKTTALEKQNTGEEQRRRGERLKGLLDYMHNKGCLKGVRWRWFVFHRFECVWIFSPISRLDILQNIQCWSSAFSPIANRSQTKFKSSCPLQLYHKSACMKNTHTYIIPEWIISSRMNKNFEWFILLKGRIRSFDQTPTYTESGSRST